MTSARESDRLRTLLETGIAIRSELSLDAVLERIVHAAAALTGARASLPLPSKVSPATQRARTAAERRTTERRVADFVRPMPSSAAEPHRKSPSSVAHLRGQFNLPTCAPSSRHLTLNASVF